MFGNVQEPAKPEPAATKTTNLGPNLADQAHAFFAGIGAKVSTTATPRPRRPGTVALLAAGPQPRSIQPSHFSDSSDEVARLRAEAMAAEADIVDDTYFECDAPRA